MIGSPRLWIATLSSLANGNCSTTKNISTPAANFRQLVSDREITVLIAKMYAEQMIASKEADAGVQTSERELPRNLPDLMLGYVKRLNDQVKADRQDIRKVVNVAKIVAWECLKQTCRPTMAKRNDVLKALSKEPDAESLLKYLEDRLQIIQTTGPVSELVRFSLDPLAEYLAAQYLVERCGKFEDTWREFFENAEKQPGTPETIKGFLMAVCDCCVEKGIKYDVPEWVGEKLIKITSLDQETRKTVQLKQRIKLLSTHLKSPNADDRKTAARKLGKIGAKAKETTPNLIVALNDHDKKVRSSAASALRKIGSGTVPALLSALNDQVEWIRRTAIEILGEFGPEAKEAVPALVAALNDQSKEVRSSASSTLGKIGQGAVRALIAALKDQSGEVGKLAASALGRIGPKAREAVPALIIALNDQSEGVRGLRRIGVRENRA